MNLVCLYYKRAFKPKMEVGWFFGMTDQGSILGAFKELSGHIAQRLWARTNAQYLRNLPAREASRSWQSDPQFTYKLWEAMQGLKPRVPCCDGQADTGFKGK